jgi:hypothetical protein
MTTLFWGATPFADLRKIEVRLQGSSLSEPEMIEYWFDYRKALGSCQ